MMSPYFVNSALQQVSRVKDVCWQVPGQEKPWEKAQPEKATASGAAVAAPSISNAGGGQEEEKPKRRGRPPKVPARRRPPEPKEETPPEPIEEPPKALPPVKRKRGRPPKGAATSSEASRESKDASEGGASVMAEAQPLAKKKRGRPPKKVVLEDSDAGGVVSELSTDVKAAESEGQGGRLQPAKRGRPPKKAAPVSSGHQDSAAHAMDSERSVGAEAAELDAPQPPKKRGRPPTKPGRPRKNPLPPEAAGPSAAAASSEGPAAKRARTADSVQDRQPSSSTEAAGKQGKQALSPKHGAPPAVKKETEKGKNVAPMDLEAAARAANGESASKAEELLTPASAERRRAAALPPPGSVAVEEYLVRHLLIDTLSASHNSGVG